MGQRLRWGGREAETEDRRKVNLDAAVVLQPSGWIQKETQAHLFDSRGVHYVCVLKRKYAVDYTPTLDFDDPHTLTHKAILFALKHNIFKAHDECGTRQSDMDIKQKQR